MNLTKEEQAVLDGEQGEGKRKAMEILVALGKIYGAERLLPIKNAQIAGVSYHNLGDAGMEFLETLAEEGAKVEVPAMLNPAGMDLIEWKKLGIPEDFAKKQKRIVDAYVKMGVKPTCTCTPYLVGFRPEYGQHVAWSESSAVTYANSVIGARTNREGGPSALAAAIIGKTPYYGLHLKKNREPTILIQVRTDLERPSDFGALGYAIGTQYPNEVPYIIGISTVNESDLKSLSASIVTYGGAPLYHIENITPEARRKIHPLPKEKGIVEEEEIREAYEAINDEMEEVEFVCIGCPHCSLEEIKKIAKLLDGKSVKRETWIATSRKVKAQADRRGYTKVIEKAGVKFACDTCMAVAPLKGRFKSMMSNSAKASYYARGNNNMKTRFGSIEECIKTACGG